MASEDAFIIGALLLLVAMILSSVSIARRYVRVPSDKAMVVHGSGKGIARILVIGPGGGKFIRPIIESYEFVSLSAEEARFKIPVQALGGATARWLDVSFVYAVPAEEEKIKAAAQLLGGKNPRDAKAIVESVLATSVNQVTGSASSRELGSDPSKLAEAIRQAAAPDLARLGLAIITIRVQVVEGGSGRTLSVVPPGVEGAST